MGYAMRSYCCKLPSTLLLTLCASVPGFTGTDSIIGSGDPIVPPGLSFRVSESIRAQCRKDLARSDHNDCVEIGRELARMALEAREEPWATRTEEKFRRHVEAAGAAYEIRSLECRQRLCAVEISSDSGYAGNVWTYQFKRETRILIAFGGHSPVLHGFESNASGTHVDVGVCLFERRD
jgi:hypothetical protein